MCGQDPDLWSYFEACDIIKGIDSSFNREKVKMQWKSEHGSLENDLKPLVNDEDASLLAMCAEETKCDVEIYTEAKSCSGGKTYMERLKEKEKGHVNVEESEKGEGSQSSEDFLDSIHFDDREEERMHDFDDVIGEGQVDGNGSVQGDGTGTIQADGTSTVQADDTGRVQADGIGTGQGIHKGFTTVEMDMEHVIDDDYIIDELDSGADDDSDDGRSAGIRFNED